jgi:hypothetical protein
MVLNQEILPLPPLIGYEYKIQKVELLAICRSANINTLHTSLLRIIEGVNCGAGTG